MADNLNQSSVQQSLRDGTDYEGTYNEDWHAYWDLAGIATDRKFEERMLLWINGELGANYTNLMDAKAAYAASKGVSRWDDVDRIAVFGKWTWGGETGVLKWGSKILLWV